MNPYLFQTAKKIIAGPHTFEYLSEHLQVIKGVKSIYILCQPSTKRLGYLDSMIKQLKQTGYSVEWNMDVKPEPTIQDIEQIFLSFQQARYDLIIGIGGGSVLDVAKLLSVLTTNPLSLREMLGVDKIQHPAIPTLLIPTTSGTGSEVTPNAIVTLPEEELKIGIVSRYLLPELVIIDPVLTLDLPKAITAATGMDAFTHAFESYISNKANPFSDLFALESISKISHSIQKAYHQGDDLTAREEMMVGSMYGGMALSCAGTAAVHAMAYPIGGKFNVTHGVANSMLLPHVTEFNLDVIADKLVTVASAMGIARKADESSMQTAEKVLVQIKAWTKELEIPQSLESYGVKHDDVAALAIAASKVTRLMDNNPKKMTVEDIANIYRKLLI